MNYLVTDEQLTATADAIREKTGGTDLITWDDSKGFADVVSGISAGGGGNEMLDALIDGSIKEINNNTVKSVRNTLFYEIGLVGVNMGAVETIGVNSFARCPSLITAIFPSVKTIGGNAFDGCKLLTTANFQSLESASNFCFRECANIKGFTFPALTSIGVSTFYGCISLEIIDFHKLSEITQYAFSGDYNLRTLVLRKSDSICTLSDISAFDKTPFASNGTGGTVYCPQVLIETYQNATNWSTLYAAGTCNFVAIEGSEYE
jgi:hypothetical protein